MRKDLHGKSLNFRGKPADIDCAEIYSGTFIGAGGCHRLR